MKKSRLSVLVFRMFVIALRAQDATRGAALYKQQCASCHGDALEGRSGPSLAGGDFRSRWPTADLTDKIRNTMPQDNPGKLTAGQAADLAAYIQQVGKAAANAEPATACARRTAGRFPRRGKSLTANARNHVPEFQYHLHRSDARSRREEKGRCRRD